MVEWRAIAGWEGIYEVSNDGRVRRLPRTDVRINRGVRQVINYPARELKGSLRNGYLAVHLKFGRDEKVYIHRVVCTAFHGTAPTGYEVAHFDGSRTNNCAGNLRWASRLENMRDKAVHGTQPKGELFYNSKLTDEIVHTIRRSSLSSKEWAGILGVNASTISVARSGKTWKHVGKVSI